MRLIRYALAMSLDGYIAGPNGEYDWIEMKEDEVEPFFKAFYAQFDTAVMGRKSFEQYGGAVQGMRTLVFSHTLSPNDHKDVTVLGKDGFEKLEELRAEDGKDIWLFGGGILFGSLATQGLVDTVEVSIVPVLLGDGKPIVTGNKDRIKLKLMDSEPSPTGFVTLKYAIESHDSRT